MSEKIVGYILLTIGIVMMIGSAFSVYRVFTKQSEPIKLFNYSGISIDTSQMFSGILPQELQDLSKQNQKKAGPTNKTELISGAMLNETANLAAHFFLMSFFISFGYKIAALGVNLIRPVIVNYKVKDSV